jgi:4-hydroxythreonine-4-phosphate dehydrogenase
MGNQRWLDPGIMLAYLAAMVYQGHVPLKLLDFERSVNVALGLPIIRASVDHSTAFDIAGRGVASGVSLIEALDFAARLAEMR